MVKEKAKPKRQSKEQQRQRQEENESLQNSGRQFRSANTTRNGGETSPRGRQPAQRPAAAQPSASKKKRAKPGTAALKEIRHLQTTTSLLIPKAPFLRIIRQVIYETTNNPTYRVTEAAVEALREAAESMLVSIFEDSYLLALHAKRVTLFPRDLNLLLRIRNDLNLLQ